MRKLSLIAAMILAAASSAFAGVSVSSPTAGSTVGSPVHFVASASGSSTISAMKVYVDGNTAYTTSSASINTYLSMGTGTHSVVTNAWDNSGNLYQDKRTITVGSTSTTTSSSTASTSLSTGGVTITSPANGSTTSTSVHVVASASSNTGYPIASMIAYIDGNRAYTTYSAGIDTYLSMGSGSHTITVNSWDNSGKVYTNAVTITAGSGTTTATSTSSTSAGVHFSSPSNGASVSSPFTVNASAASSTSYPIASMILYVDGNQNKLVYANSLSTSVSVGSGSHILTIHSWDNSGNMYTAQETVTVGGTTTASTASSSSSSSSGNTIYGIESMSGWQSCSSCAGNVSGTAPSAGWGTSQYQSSPSLDGSSTKYSIWGSTPFTDVLWYKSLTSSMGGTGATNNAHHFIYDAYFYINNPQYTQALEFDINQFVNGHSLIFGMQCNLLNGHQWDYWNNRQQTWVHSGIYCGTPSANSWHHVILEVERLSGDELHYISVTLDGNKQYYNKYDWPTSTSWSGVTVNFQMDGDYAEHSYSVWLDKFNFIYW